MAKKVHVTRFDEGVEERAIQMRSDDPVAPQESQFWFNKETGKLAYYLGGEERTLNVRVLSGDPTSPNERELWINGTTDELKYKYQGTVRTVSLGNVKSIDGGTTAQEYLGILDEAELQIISDVSSAYPDYLIESFKDIKPTVALTNTNITQDFLSINDGETSGSYEREVRKGKILNFVEGTMVVSSQGFAPKTITDNLDGTHTIIFRGDITNILADGMKIVEFETDMVEGAEQDFPLLNNLGKPAILEIFGAPTYNSGTNETTIVIMDDDLDLTMGLSISEREEALKFASLGVSVQAGANGLSGTLGSLEVLEMFSHDAERILGEELFSLIPTFHKGSTNNLVVKHSENRKYWVIVTQEEIRSTVTTTANVARLYYSTDGLKTLQLHPTWEKGFTGSNVNESSIMAGWNSNNIQDYTLNQQNIHIYNDGKAIVGKGIYQNSTYWQWEYFQMDLSKPSFFPEPIPSAGGYNGAAMYSTAEQGYTANLTMLESQNILAVVVTNSASDPYVFFYNIDFEDSTNSLFLGRSFLGTDFHSIHYPLFHKFINYEGQMQYFILTRHGGNGYYYAQSVYLSDILAGNTNGTFPRTDLPARGAFASAATGGTRHSTTALWHTPLAIAEYPIGYLWNEVDQELLCFINDNDGQFYLGTINFARTNPGTSHVENMTVANAPIVGTFVMSILDGETSTTVNSAAINFNDTAAQIQTKLGVLTTFNNGVSVTGDWISGFQVNDLNTTGNPKPLTFSATSNSLRYAGGAPFLGDANTDTSVLIYSIDRITNFAEGQQFTTTTQAQIDSVSIRIGKTPGAIPGSTVRVRIRTSSTTPTATILATSASVNYETLPDHTNTSSLVNFIFPAGVVLSAGTYYFTLEFDTHNGTDIIYVYRSSVSTNPGAVYFATSSALTAWTVQTGDLAQWSINMTALLAVNPSFSTVTLGVLPKWLFVTNALTNKWEETGTYMLLKRTSLEQLTNYVAGGISHIGSYYKMLDNRFRLDGRTIHATLDLQMTDSDYDATECHYWKIPDYRQFLGYPINNVPGSIVALYIGRPASGNNFGGKLAEVITIPTVPNISHYPDGKVPIRSIDLYAMKDWTTNSEYNRISQDWKIRVSLWGLTLGVPDEAKRICNSVQEYRVIDLPNYDDLKWVTFDMLGDNRFSPGQQVAIVVEPINFDGTLLGQTTYPTGRSGPETSALIRFSGRSVVSSRFYRWNGTVFESKDYELWYRIGDFYNGVLPVAQNNNFRAVRGWANDQWYREDSQSNIEWIDKSAKSLRVHYRNSGLVQLNDTNYTGEGAGAKNFYGEIIDENGQFHYPTLTPAKWLGQAEGSVDKEIRWATVMGHPETIYVNNITGEKVYPVFTPAGQSPQNRFNWQTAFGGLPLNSSDSSTMYTLASESGLNAGVKQDANFYYGWCTHMRGNRVYYSWNSRQLAPGHEDFYIIIEIDPDTEDMDGSLNMCFSVTELFYMGIDNTSKYNFWIKDHGGTGDTYKTFSGTVLSGRHFVKFYRDFNGIKIARSIDGINWVQLPIDPSSSTSSNDGSKYQRGLAVGDGTVLSGTVYVGGYWANTSYQWQGKIGIIKYGVGASHPTARGVEVEWGWMDVHNPFNLGDRFIGSKVITNGRTSVHTTKHGKLAQMFALSESSKVRTRDQVLKFRSVIAEGNKAAIKIDLTKNSDADPLSIQGYLLNFEYREV